MATAHDDQVQRAETFLALHHGPEVLVLLNAWDVASARIFAACGSRAIGTTSMGIAAVAGFPDVERIGRDAMLDAVGRIARSVEIPVSADLERGYGGGPDEVATTIERALDCGVVGVNIEDGSGEAGAPVIEIEAMCERVGAARSAAATRGVPLVINARTDVYLSQAGAPGQRLAEAVRRGNAYRDAGADCVFVPGGLERETVRELARELEAPLNVVANPALSIPVVPTVPELQDLGVARLSVGSGALRTTLSLTQRIAEEVLKGGVYGIMAEELGRPDAARAYRAAIGAPET